MPRPNETISLLADGSIRFVLTARDQYGNAIANNASGGILRLLARVGGTFDVATTPSFAGLTARWRLMLLIRIAESFSVRATQIVHQVTGLSGLITVNADQGNLQMAKITADTSIIAGTDIALRVQVTDGNSNPIVGTQVTTLLMLAAVV